MSSRLLLVDFSLIVRQMDTASSSISVINPHMLSHTISVPLFCHCYVSHCPKKTAQLVPSSFFNCYHYFTDTSSVKEYRCFLLCTQYF